MNVLAGQQLALKRAIVHGLHGDAVPCTEVTGLLRIYRQAYAARLTAALRDNFGVLPQVLGDAAFEALALAYLEAHPSQRPSIRWFGDRLPGFMAARDDLVPHPAIVDLARMEWALRGAFDAADAPVVLGVAALAALPAEAWPSLVFESLPSVQLMALGWSVEPVWRALQGTAPDDEALELPEPQAHAHHLLVWRQGLETRWRSLDVGAARLLKGALQGETFGTLCEMAAAEVGSAHAAPHAAKALRGWLDDGLFSGWRAAPNPRPN
jgi:Putative DNA-binding domain